MRINVNLDDVQEDQPLTPDWYPVRVVGAEVKNAKDGESQYIALDMEITAGDAEGRHVFDNLSLKERALFKLKKFMKAAGIPWEPDGFNTEDMYGAELEVYVDNEEYQGELRNRVQKYRAIA